MARGPTTPELVVAAARSGGLGFLAGGYLTAEALGAEMDVVRRQTPTFGVNLFAPRPVPVDRAAYDRYRAVLRSAAERFGVSLPVAPIEDDDRWSDKIALLSDQPVPIVSFTFGIPDAPSLAALRKTGSVTVQTVTSVREALMAVECGVDALAVQASAAGGHSGTFTPDRIPPAMPLRELLAAVNHVVALPTVAAGGLADPVEVAAAIRGGAQAVMVGTVLLRSPESGASAAHRKALVDPHRGDTVVTRAFTGRPARALPNTFIDSYGAVAPAGYPAVHHLTRPVRQASAAADDPEFVNLWAGTGYRSATAQPAELILRGLARDL